MFKNYLLTAFKVYARRKLFTTINLLCIVLTLVVLMVVTALLQASFFPTGVEGKSDRFLQVHTVVAHSADGKSTRRTRLGYKLIEKYLKPMKTPSLVAAVSYPHAVSAYQSDRVTELQMRRTDAAYWQVLDFELLAGRLPRADDDVQGRFVVVLNQSSAKKLFADAGGDLATVVGKALNLGGQTFEVIGVVRDVMHLNAFADVWAPITTLPSTEYKNQTFGEFSALLMGHSAADLPRIQEELQQVSQSVVLDDPKAWSRTLMWADSKLDLFARTLFDNNETADSGARKLLLGIGSVMLLFMLLPALNLVNLNIGRILERSAEIGVRKAFGATSAQLVVQLVVENMLLCLVGGLLGLLCAKGVLLWLEGSGLIPYLKVDIQGIVFAYGLAITAVFGLLSGVIPAWKMSRLDPVFALKGAV